MFELCSYDVLLFFSARCIYLEGWGLFRKLLPVVRCLCFLGAEGGKEGGRDNCCYHKFVTCCKEGHEAASFLSSVNFFCGFRTPLGASLDEQSNPLLKGKEGLSLPTEISFAGNYFQGPSCECL